MQSYGQRLFVQSFYVTKCRKYVLFNFSDERLKSEGVKVSAFLKQRRYVPEIQSAQSAFCGCQNLSWRLKCLLQGGVCSMKKTECLLRRKELLIERKKLLIGRAISNFMIRI